MTGTRRLCVDWVGGGPPLRPEPLGILKYSAQGSPTGPGRSLCKGNSMTDPVSTSQPDPLSTASRDVAEVPSVEIISTAALHLMSAAAVNLGLAEDLPQGPG